MPISRRTLNRPLRIPFFFYPGKRENKNLGSRRALFPSPYLHDGWSRYHHETHRFKTHTTAAASSLMMALPGIIMAQIAAPGLEEKINQSRGGVAAKFKIVMDRGEKRAWGGSRSRPQTHNLNSIRHCLTNDGDDSRRRKEGGNPMIAICSLSIAPFIIFCVFFGLSAAGLRLFFRYHLSDRLSHLKCCDQSPANCQKEKRE